LFYWSEDPTVNFGDVLSKVIVERIVGKPLKCYVKKGKAREKKLLAIGSILYFACDGDVVWGSGVNGKILDRNLFEFDRLDIRAVRGPLTRRFLLENFGIQAPEIYGDPALPFPYLFPEFKKKENPSIPYLIVPHYADKEHFPKSEYDNVVYTSEPWDFIVEKILDSRLVISSSLHAVVVAESYGIPARVLRISESKHNHALKYTDYYLGTNRPDFQFATSIEEALRMGGEPPFECDLKKLYEAFPIEFYPSSGLLPLTFSQ
jgi:pyruvyltransferase